MNNQVSSTSNMSRNLFLGSGFIFLFAAIFYNEFTLVLFAPDPPLYKGTVTNIRKTQLIFMLIGFTFIFISFIINKISWLESFSRNNLIINILLATLTVFTLLFILELSLAPLVHPGGTKTTIFTRDNELGWKLKPGADDLWRGVRTKINRKGLRGPELSYDKQSNVKRILYLGDSVTFGFLLKSYRLSFPYLIEGILENKLKYEIETINAGVGGYSPWQEHIFLITEGIKYDPDLVVVSFVLNDVTEKFGLIKFGGGDEGFQLRMTASSFAYKFFYNSNIYNIVKKMVSRIRFGSNIQKGAQKKEALDVLALAQYPDRQDVKKGWKITLRNLGKIFDYANDKNIPVLLVVFPFTFQFDDPSNLSTPQQVVAKYGFDNKVQVIDLLPILSKKMKETDSKPKDYFFDSDHLNPAGSKVVANILADFIQQERLLTNQQTESFGQHTPNLSISRVTNRR